MAMRTRKSGPRVPSRSRAPHGKGRTVPAGRAPRGVAGKGTKPSGNGAGAAPAPAMPTSRAQRAAWEKRFAEAKQRPDLYPFTISGIPIKPLYTPEDLAGVDQVRDLGYPGEY